MNLRIDTYDPYTYRNGIYVPETVSYPAEVIIERDAAGCEPLRFAAELKATRRGKNVRVHFTTRARPHGQPVKNRLRINDAKTPYLAGLAQLLTQKTPLTSNWEY